MLAWSQSLVYLHDTVYKNSKNENALINKVTNGRNKQTLYIYNFFRLCTQLYSSLPKTGAESCLKKNLEYESILHNFTELLVDWTPREFQKQTILFPKKISDIYRERLMFHSIQCRNCWLAASDLFDMFAQ